MSGVNVSRGDGPCLKKSCAKSGIYKVGEVLVCRSHLRQVLDDALLLEDKKVAVMVSGRPPDSEEGKAALADLAQAALKLAAENPCLEFDVDLHIDWKGRFERLERRIVEEGFDVQELMSRMEPKGEGTKVECVCPVKPCAFCALPLKDRLAQTGSCTRPDVDEASIYCGHPLPCPRHPAGNK